MPIAAKSIQKEPQEEREVAIPPFPLDSYPTQTPTQAPFIAVKTVIFVFPRVYYLVVCRRHRGLGRFLRGEGVVGCSERANFTEVKLRRIPLLNGFLVTLQLLAKSQRKMTGFELSHQNSTHFDVWCFCLPLR